MLFTYDWNMGILRSGMKSKTGRYMGLDSLGGRATYIFLNANKTVECAMGVICSPPWKTRIEASTLKEKGEAGNTCFHRRIHKPTVPSLTCTPAEDIITSISLQSHAP
ncbi:hypothetical protein DL546_006031 [Coniochaeta pulveracea]|uniref:Uncharacterized protein n=1 Tax=Coniochaeta pulveracea TaxID=177199 RepID=A0A420YMS4_9PEZI|nr:hypothetical protein DL546_006031 [Coniochaeta pulveracea]